MKNNCAAPHFTKVNSGTRSFSITERREHALNTSRDDIADERAVAMVYNGISHAVMMATPADLEDFALGFSLSEGIIEKNSQIKSIELTESELGFEVQVDLTNEPFMLLKQRRRHLSGRSGCGLCGLDSLAAIKPKVKSVAPSPLPSYTIIADAAKKMHQQQTLRSVCGAVHGAAFFNKHGDALVVREDVGRHNALDKLLGALANSLQAQEKTQGFIFISSRASYEMVFKAASQGYNCIAAESAPTSMAIDLAKEAGMNLIGFVRDNRQVIYNQTITNV